MAVQTTLARQVAKTMACKIWNLRLSKKRFLTTLFERKLAKDIGMEEAAAVNDLFKSMRKDFRQSPKAVRTFPVYDVHHPFIKACIQGNSQLIARLLRNDNVDPSVYENSGILLALQERHLRIVHLLMMEDIRLDDHSNLLFRLACEMGCLGIVKALLKKEQVDPTACENEGLRFALSRFQLTVAETLLRDTRVDPSAGGNMAIAYFSSFGRADVVEKLLKDSRVDPSDNEDLALLHATRKSCIKTIEALLRDSRVNPINSMKLAKAMKHERMIALFDRFISGKRGVSELSKNNAFSHVKMTNLLNTANIRINNRNENIPIGKNKEFIDAIAGRDSKNATNILKSGDFDPSECDNFAIRLACANGLLEVVQILLENPKVDPSAVNNEALKVSSFFGHYQVVKELIKDGRVDPSAWNNFALRNCAFRGEEELLEQLLADPKVDPSDIDNEAIISASNRRHFSIICRLLKDSRVDPSARRGVVLIDACRDGSLEYLNELLNDSRINRSVDYDKALICAIRRGDSAILKRLMKDSRFVPSENAIMTAFKHDREDITELILQNPNFDPSLNGNFPIVFICRSGYLKACEILLNDSRVDPAVWDNLPIRVAAISSHFGIVEKLLKDERVDPFTQGNIVQHIATLHNKQNILSLLEKHPKNSGFVTKETLNFVQDFNYKTPVLFRDDHTSYFTPAPIADWTDDRMEVKIFI